MVREAFSSRPLPAISINSASVGINVYNQATSIAQAANSSILVTAYGTINSGTTYTGGGSRPAGILAGYKGGTTNTPNSTAFGNVTVDNSATINAAGGDGIRAYNYGPGNVTVNDHAGTIVAQDMFGISASTNGTGNVSVSTDAGITIKSGTSGIQAINNATAVPVGTSTVSVTARGTINSGTHLTPGGSQPQAISAGYFGEQWNLKYQHQWHGHCRQLRQRYSRGGIGDSTPTITAMAASL